VTRRPMLWAALTVLLGAGCTGLSREQVARVRPGSSRAEVVQLLGRPTLSTPGTFVYVGGDGRQAVVSFDQQGLATETQWWPAPDGPIEATSAARPLEDAKPKQGVGE